MWGTLVLMKGGGGVKNCPPLSKALSCLERGAKRFGPAIFPFCRPSPHPPPPPPFIRLPVINDWSLFICKRTLVKMRNECKRFWQLIKGSVGNVVDQQRSVVKEIVGRLVM